MASASYRGRMIVNDTDYTGSFVDPNPEGVATDDLNTVAIDGHIFNVVGSGGGGTKIILNGQIYSTEEKVVGVWKNNKPLYQKTCVFGSVSGQTASLSLGIANIEEAFLCAEASYVNDGTCPLPYVTGTAYANNIGGFFDIGVSDTSFAIRIGQSMAGNINSVVLTVRYTKTTDTAGSGGYQAYGFTPVIYSTEEREVGVWKDNKPLYQKTFSVTINSTDYIIDLSSLSVEQITTYIGYINHVDGTWNLHFPYYDSDRYYSVGEYNNNTKELHIASSGNMVTQYPYVTFTIQYTKTTDVVGSGSYNTLGVPNVHYTTDEQVIGTWVGGKPLYQKTLAIHNSSVVDSDRTITTIDSTFRVKNWEAFAIENGVNYKIPYVAGSGNASFFFRENGNVEFTIRNTTFAAGSDFYITIEYTKTTD